MGSLHLPHLFQLAFLAIFITVAWKAAAADPTDGFTSLPLNISNFVIQIPYNIPQKQRYNFVDGVHKLSVYDIDMPHTPTSHTHARTEIRIHGYDYSSGVWQFEGYGYIPTGTSGVSVMQVFGASGHATTAMLHVYNGNLSYYTAPVLVPHIYDHWFRANVIHDVERNKVQVYINGELKYETAARGGNNHFFKFGVYSQEIATWSPGGRTLKCKRKCDICLII